MTPIDLARVQADSKTRAGTPGPPAPPRLRFDPSARLGHTKRIPGDLLVLFTRQLALLLQTGNALVPSIRALHQQAQHPVFRSVLGEIGRHLEEGRGLSETLALHPTHFDRFFVSVVRAGEASGRLQACLEHLSRALETRRRLRARIVEAMTYPAILVVVMTGVMIFMYAFMLPRFAELFADLTHELPVTTRLLLRSSTVLRSSWPWLIPIPVVAGVVVSRLWRTARMKRFRDELKLSVPVVRRLYEEAYLFQLFLSLGLLLGSHVPHLEAIEIARDTVGNLRYRRFFGRLRENVEAGRGMAHAFAEAAFIPEAVKLMVTTGEQAGTLDVVMVRLSERFREDLESDIRRLGSLLEPLMLVVMGIAVGTIATSLIIPIFRLSRTVH